MGNMEISASAQEAELRRQICEIGRRMYDKDLAASNAGNISVRLADGSILCTPTGISKGFMTEECLCVIDLDGNVLRASAGWRPSSEMKMHRRVYQRRPDVQAVVHAHPVYATTFAAAGIPLDRKVLAEPIVDLNYVPVAEYGTPSTDEVPDSIEKYLQDFDAILLGNHGALTYSDDLIHAYYNMEMVEFYARTIYQLTLLGAGLGTGPAGREFTQEQLSVLNAMHEKARRKSK